MRTSILAVVICAILTSCATGPTRKELAVQAATEQVAEQAATAEKAWQAVQMAIDAKVSQVNAIEREGDDAAQLGDFQKALDNYASAISMTTAFDTNGDMTQEELDIYTTTTERTILSRIQDKVAKTTIAAKMAKVKATEKTGDDAAQSGNAREAITDYTSALQITDQPSDDDRRLREKIAKYVSTLAQPPQLPEEAKSNAVLANALFKNDDTSDLPEAVDKMRQVMLMAPWWADGYYNLGLMQERAGQFGDAAESLKLYVLAAPHSTDADAIQTKSITDTSFQTAMNEYQKQFADDAAGEVIKLAATMDPMPAIPEEARKHFIRGATMFKDAKISDDYDQAMTEFEQATQEAPWWPEARYNLALACEGKGDYEEAISSLNLYLLFKLSDAEARQTKDKVYALQAEEDQTAKRKEREREEAQTEREEQIGFWAGKWVFSDEVEGSIQFGNLPAQRITTQPSFGVSVDGSGAASALFMLARGDSYSKTWYGTATKDSLTLQYNSGLDSGRLELFKNGGICTAVFNFNEHVSRDTLFNDEGTMSFNYNGRVNHAQ